MVYRLGMKNVVYPIFYNKSCGRNESFPNKVLFALGMGQGADATLTNLFNSTSGRDASHPCLISTWSKEGCTIVCVELLVEEFDG